MVLSIIFGSLTIFKPNILLFGDNRIVYEDVLTVAYDFKNPASVRVMSGRVLNGSGEKDYDYMVLVRISATNSYGGYVTSEYCMVRYSEDGVYALELEEDDADKTRQDWK